jgi:hypothetical protein
LIGANEDGLFPVGVLNSAFSEPTTKGASNVENASAEANGQLRIREDNSRFICLA